LTALAPDLLPDRAEWATVVPNTAATALRTVILETEPRCFLAVLSTILAGIPQNYKLFQLTFPKLSPGSTSNQIFSPRPICNPGHSRILSKTNRMNQDIQLQIPMRCHEHWANMQPTTTGRHCQSCCKTVVDFTAMGDQEMITYLARAGQGVCGRFAPDQLDRALSLTPIRQKSGWRGWAFVLAGLLAAIRLPAQKRIVTTSPIHQQIAAVTTQPAADSFKVLAPVVVTGYASKCYSALMGAVSIGRVIKTDPWKKTIKDSITTFLPKKELSVYPNPVRRGGAISLSWQTTPGTYQVGIYNTAGALIRQRTIQVGEAAQVDLVEVPPSLSSGVYLLSAVRTADGKRFTRELVVL
jgi:hypothetical protein